MKYLLYAAVLITFCSCKDNKPSIEAPPLPEKRTATQSPDHSSGSVLSINNVDDIKKEFKYITTRLKEETMDSSSFNYNCHDEKSGRVTYYSEQSQLRMIRHIYNEYSHFSATDEYYFKGGDPFFVYKKHIVWSFTGENQTKDNITEERFYIAHNKPITCLQKKFFILSNEKVALQSDKLPNKPIECPSLTSIAEDLPMLWKLRDQKEDIHCLEK